MKRIFKINDRVYHHFYGWGNVINIEPNYSNVSELRGFRYLHVLFDNGMPNNGMCSILMGQEYLSFEKYSLEKGGFNQKRK